MRNLLFVTILLLPFQAIAQDRTQNVDVGQIEDVRLGDDGRAVLRFRTEHTGRLRGDIFAAPTEAGVINVTFRERSASDDENKTETLPTVWEPGRYEAVVQAVNPGAALVQLRVSVDIPLDEFEPNDTRETAMRVDLPFAGVLRLSAGDSDWFRVNPDSGGIVGVHLHTSYSYSGPRIGIFDADGNQLLLTEATQWGHRGMRYVRATGRPLFIQLTDTNTYGEGDANAFKTVEIVQYSPEGAPASARSLVTLSLESDDPSIFQLDLIGDAIGVETVAADEAESVAQELETAIRGRRGGWGWFGLILLLLLVAGGGGYFFWRHRKGS